MNKIPPSQLGLMEKEAMYIQVTFETGLLIMISE